MAEYLTVYCRLLASQEDELAELMEAAGALGSEIAEAGGDRITVTVYLAGDRQSAVPHLERSLEALGAQQVQRGGLAHRDWLEAYRQQVRPFAVGRRWWVDPHPQNPTVAPLSRTRLAIEPRMAFGSGSHESTQLVLLELEDLELCGRSVLDVGSGSGVLGLAAEALGAAWVLGVDNDPEAVWAARQIARQQDWPSRVRYAVGTLECVGEVEIDVVLCNMIVDQIVLQLSAIRRLAHNGGLVILSGILEDQVDRLAAELQLVGLATAGQRGLGEWRCLRVRRE